MPDYFQTRTGGVSPERKEKSMKQFFSMGNDVWEFLWSYENGFKNEIMSMWFFIAVEGRQSKG